MPDVGDTVIGTVIANAPFGIWLDIGAGIPGLLEIIQLNKTVYPPENYPGFMPEIGSKILAKVTYIEERQICLSQKFVDEKTNLDKNT